MADLRKHSATSNLIRMVLRLATTGVGLTGLTEASSGLVIATVADVEATTTRYRAGSSEIETISTLGTFAAPSTNKCRFKEFDATNHPGLYEIQLANARFSVTNAKRLIVTVYGATNLQSADYEIQLVQMDPYESAWEKLFASAATIWRGSATSTTNTTTLTDTTLTQPDTDWWKGRVIIFAPTSSLGYQASVITGFTPASDTLTFTAVTAAVQSGDAYVIV